MNVLATKNTAAGIMYLPVAVVGVIIVGILMLAVLEGE